VVNNKCHIIANSKLMENSLKLLMGYLC